VDCDPVVAQRAALLSRLLARFLMHRDVFELVGPFTAPRAVGTDGGWHPRVDERYLAGAQTAIGGLIADLCARGPEGAKLAMDIVFERTVAHAEAMSLREETAEQGGTATGKQGEGR
jgi:hypothetical protein